jgi:hypothetical protein
MSDDKYNVNDIVNFSAQEKPVNVKSAVDLNWQTFFSM